MRLPFRWKTRLAVVAAALAVVGGVLLFADRFLAVHNPVGQGILVIEAWIPIQSVAETAQLFQTGGYTRIVLVGSTAEKRRMAIASRRLQSEGIRPTDISLVVSGWHRVGRTYANAEAVRDWMGASRAAACCVEVVTEGVHARKSWISFQSALGKRYRVGIVAAAEKRYNARSWLWSRRRLYIVARNLCGYLLYKLWLGGVSLRFGAA